MIARTEFDIAEFAYIEKKNKDDFFTLEQKLSQPQKKIT